MLALSYAMHTLGTAADVPCTAGLDLATASGAAAAALLLPLLTLSSMLCLPDAADADALLG